MTYNKFWTRVTDVLRGSLFGRVFLCIVQTIRGMFHSSWLYSFFTSHSMQTEAESAKIPAFVRQKLFESKFSEMISESWLIKIVCRLGEYFFGTKVSVLAFYLVPAGVLMFISNFGNIGAMVGFSVVILAGIVMLGCMMTFGKLFSGSKIMSALCRFFNIDTELAKSTRYTCAALFALIGGLIAGAFSFFVSAKLTAIITVGLLLLPLITASPLLLIVLSLFSGIVMSTLPASLLAALTFIVVLCRLYGKREKLPKLRTVYLLTVIYMILTAFYTFFGYGGSDGMLAGFIQTVFLLFFISVTIVINSAEKFRKAVFAISTCTLYTSFLGLYQRFSGQGGTGWSNTEEYVGGLKRISATFLNPNVYGEFLILACGITVAAILLSKTKLQRIFFIGCFLLQGINLALTYSRGCYISLAFALLIIVWCCDKRLLCAGFFALPVLPKVLPQNIITRILSVGSYLEDSSVLYRFSIWKASLRVIQNHWYVGSGVGTVAFTAFYQNYMINGVTAQHSHNVFLQITIELSILALLLMILIMFAAVRDCGNVLKGCTDVGKKFYIIPFIAVLAGVMIEGLVDYLFYNNIVYMYFWSVLALLVCGLNIVGTATSEKGDIKL